MTVCPTARARALFWLALIPAGLAAQTPGAPTQWREPRRPVPNPVVPPPPEFARAISRGTRTASGVPGPRYWQQHARYAIAVRLDTGARRLDGTTRIVYHNNSPGTLRSLHIQLLQNYHRDKVPRLEASAPEITGGYTFTRVAAGGRALLPAQGSLQGPGYLITNGNMVVVPPAPLPPGDSVALEMEWNCRIHRPGPRLVLAHLV